MPGHREAAGGGEAAAAANVEATPQPAAERTRQQRPAGNAETHNAGSSIPAELRNDPEAIAALRRRWLEEQGLATDQIIAQRRNLNQAPEQQPGQAQQAGTEVVQTPEQARATANTAAHELAQHAQNHAGELARAMAPNAPRAQQEELAREVAHATSKPSFFKRIGTFFKEKIFTGAAAGFAASVGTKALVRIAAINLINPSWWVYMGAGALGGAGVETFREVWKQSKKLEDLDHVLDELHNEQDLTKKALIINRLEKLQAEARINKDELSFNTLSDQLRAARMDINIALDQDRGAISRDIRKQLSYILKISDRAHGETPKSMRKNVDKLLKDLEKSWSYERTLKGLNWRRVGRAAGRGALVGAGAGAFGWLLAEKIHLAEKVYGAFRGGGGGGAGRELIQQKIETTTTQGGSNVIHLSAPHGGVHDTAWHEAREWMIHQGGVKPENINDKVLGDAIKNLAHSNGYGIHGLGIPGHPMDIHMPVGQALDMTSLNDMMIKLGGHAAGAKVEAVATVLAETPSQQAAAEGAQGMWGYLSTELWRGKTANIIAGVGEEMTLRYMKNKKIKGALHGNAVTAEAAMPGEYARLSEVGRAEWQSMLQERVHRDVTLQLHPSFSPERFVMPENQEAMRGVFDVLAERQIANRLGGVDIFLQEHGTPQEVPTPPGSRKVFLIPVDSDPNQLRAVLEAVLVARTATELTERFGDTFTVDVNAALQQRIDQGHADREMQQVSDVLSRLDPVLLGHIGNIRLGYPLGLRPRPDGQLELSFTPLAESTPVTLAVIEDLAEDMGIQFERITPSEGVQEFGTAVNSLEARMNELLAQGDNRRQIQELDQIITRLGGLRNLRGVRAEQGRTDTTADFDMNIVFVSPTVRHIFNMRQAVKRDKDFLTQVRGAGRTLNQTERASMRRMTQEARRLLAPGAENDGVLNEPTDADIRQLDGRYGVGKSRIERNYHIHIDDSPLQQELANGWSPRQKAIYYLKWNKFFNEVDRNTQMRGFLNNKNLIISNDPSEAQRVIANGNDVKIRPDLSVTAMVEALRRLENPTAAVSPAEQRNVQGYDRRKAVLQGEHITIDDAVLMTEIQGLPGERDRQNRYRAFGSLFGLVARNNELKQALANKTMHLDRSPRNRNGVRVQGNDVYVSIDTRRSPQEIFTALKAEVVPAATPNTPPNPATNNPNTAPNNPNVRTGEPTAAELGQAETNFTILKDAMKAWNIDVDDSHFAQASATWSNRQKVDFYDKMNAFWDSLNPKDLASLSGQKLIFDWALGTNKIDVKQPATAGNPREVKINPNATAAEIRTALRGMINATELVPDPAYEQAGEKQREYDGYKTSIFQANGIKFRDGSIRRDMRSSSLGAARWTPQERITYFDTINGVLEDINQTDPDVWKDMRNKTIVISDSGRTDNTRDQIWIKWDKAHPADPLRIKNMIYNTAAMR
jgi:hypothetical protein